MPQFSDLPRAILLSISHVSGETYRDIEDDELKAELVRRGLEPSASTLFGAMRALRGAGLVECEFVGGGIAFIRLAPDGRKEVEGWPASPGALSANDVQALLDARSEDPDVPEPERGKARAAASALKDLGINVTAEVIAAWLRRLGVG